MHLPRCFPGGSVVKNPSARAGGVAQSLVWEEPLRKDGNPLQYSCLENPMDRGALRALARTKIWT